MESIAARRQRLLGPNLPTFYDEPVHLVRGEGVWVWDADGRRYLDCYNNVPHVGHAHPAVVAAVAEQTAKLATHSRYLDETLLDYVEALVATFASPLDCALLTCSGSEANDVALRMAQAATGSTGVIATDHTYHGNTALVSQLSKAKTPIGGHAANVRHVPAPDCLREPRSDSADGEAAFATAVRAACEDLRRSGHGVAALIVCPYFANEGFPTLTPGFLQAAAAAVRDFGGLLIADEVQSGFGRTGESLWGHDRANVLPDIVTLGKPMGNGYPVAGVVTSADIMGEFRERYRYFNTFAGNPVAASAAHAVLRVLDEERLVENADSVGNYARAGLRELQRRHPVIGNVRGSGLFFGAEMLIDGDPARPATEFTARVAEAMRANGVLLNRLGIHYNTLKIRPPMPFSRANADRLLETLDRVLGELAPA
ncbi:MAG: aspartate aminotransferase family protein [Pseudomonadota bacterium]